MLSLLSLASGAALAQAASPDVPRGLVVTPRVSLSETYTDNNLLSNTQRDATIISVLSPGISILARGGSVTGSLDYSVSGIAYLKSEQPDRLQQNLNAQGHADIVQKVFFIDALASISQQNGSAVGPLSTDPNLGNQNRVEVQTLSISPTLRGHIGRLASVELRGTVTGTNTVDSAIGDSRQLNGSLRFDSLNAGQLRGWAALTTSKSHFTANTADSEDTQATMGLRYQPDVDFFMTVNGGRERSNYEHGAGQFDTAATYGASFSWTPSRRTSASLDWQHHSYGDSHSLRFEHRMARSVWRYSDSMMITQGSQLNTTSQGSYYDLWFQQYASLIPNPVDRDAFVRNLLLGYGLNPNSQVLVGFLSNVPLQSRNRQAAMSLEGLRTTVMFSFGQSISQQVGSSGQVAGDLANFGQVNQRVLALDVAHKTGPLSSLNFNYSQTHGGGVGLAALSNANTLNSVSAGWSWRPGPHNSLALTARHSQEVGSNPYRENALMATFVQNF